MKMKNKSFLGILLSIALILGLMPGMRMTAYADDPYASLKNTTTIVHFDNDDWYLIDYDSSTVTLLRKNVNMSWPVRIPPNNTIADISLEKLLNDYYSTQITEVAKKAVSGNGLFLLSEQQAQGLVEGVKKYQSDLTLYWWLNTPGATNNTMKCVNTQSGEITEAAITEPHIVRPALKLNRSSVSFSSETNTFLYKQNITAADITVTYGETGKSVSATTDGNGAISYAVKEGSEKYIEVNASNGAMTIKEVPSDGKAYVTVVAKETNMCTRANKEVTVTILKAKSTAATVKGNDFTYDGTEKQLVIVTDTTTGGEMQYVLGKDATTAPTDGWSTSLPTATDAGIYYVWYKVVGDANHLDSEPVCVTVTIG